VSPAYGRARTSLSLATPARLFSGNSSDGDTGETGSWHRFSRPPIASLLWERW
jgi:hypothetical protein